MTLLVMDVIVPVHGEKAHHQLIKCLFPTFLLPSKYRDLTLHKWITLFSPNSSHRAEQNCLLFAVNYPHLSGNIAKTQ
jgi:hypothetical protein